jgi:sigma-B regulation protein RsbU (phosphoserine phosphatase)
MVYGELDPATGHFRYCNAGHNYPVLARSDGSFETLETGGLLLGVFADAQYEAGETYLDARDVLVLYTDGLSEVSNQESEEFGDRRLMDAIVRNRIQGPQMICQSLLQEVLTHAQTTAFEDDATVIVLKKLDGTQAT